ncbi:MAG: CDP-alcohol phosphatidyltransferase family protein [Actinobacteria bacterium]|nr:CDP-alcohol phosphatidyltransferase family protein [Actinomycetota bacterium]
MTANQLTFFGVVLAALCSISSPRWWSAIFLALSLLGDGVDGTLAILRNKSSALGAVYDSVADRLSEALWALAFYRLGAPLTWVIIFWTLASVQEYARARLGAEGVHEVGVITPAERPMRASFLCLAIVAWQFSYFHGWVFSLILVATMLQGLSLAMVLNFAYRKLK